ncbi:uncharacterized protein LOC144651657 isoform X2 [Oculina patagonica]
MPHHVQDGRGKLFYESLEVTEQETTDKQFVFPKQCLVLGDSEVGKTSLVRSLTRKAFDPNQQKTQGIDWSLVDHDWKNCNLKDLVFGDLWRFLETGLVEMLWITTGRETSYNVAQEVTVIMTGLWRFFVYFWTLIGFIIVLFIAVSGMMNNFPVTSFVIYHVYFFHIVFRYGLYCAIHCNRVCNSDARFTIATLVFIFSRRGLLIGSYLALLICYFDEKYVELASMRAFLLLGTIAGIVAFVALFILIGPIQIPFRTSLGVLCFYRFLLSIFIGLIIGFVVAISLVSATDKESTEVPTTELFMALVTNDNSYMHDVQMACMITPFVFFSPVEFVCEPKIFDSFMSSVKDGSWGPCNILLILAVFYHCKLALTSPMLYFVIIFPLFICFTFRRKWFCVLTLNGINGSECLCKNSSFMTLLLFVNGKTDAGMLRSALNKKFPSLKLMILDFAGDKEYYAYHHIFLKSQAIYVIVFNIANFVEYNFRNINAGIVRLQFWLESVCSHVPPATPIFLVGTHRGDMDKTCMERLNVHLKTNLWDFYCDELVVNDVEELIFFPVENSIGENDVGIQSLQTKIMSVAEKSLATIDCDIPLSWISIQDAIINLREKKEAKFCVTLEEFPRALDNFICTNWSEETFKYFHEKGLVIYLDKDQELSKWVLLKPEILVDIIIQLVTPPPQMMQERGVRRDWKLLKDKGMLTQSLLESIFSKVQKNEEAMTAFLEEYDLICPLLNKKVKICSLCDDEEYQPTHFVPSLLPMSTDCSIPAWHDSTADKKFYVLFTRFLPEPLFHRMLSRAHKNSKVEFPNGPAVVFRDVGKFWMSPWQPYRLKLMKEEGVIEVTFSSSKNGMKPADVLCQVFSMVDGICKRDFPFVKFHCGPACPADECPGYHDNYMYTPHQHTRRHVYNVMPGRQRDNIASLYCVNNSFEEELEEWIP